MHFEKTPKCRGGPGNLPKGEFGKPRHKPHERISAWGHVGPYIRQLTQRVGHAQAPSFTHVVPALWVWECGAMLGPYSNYIGACTSDNLRDLDTHKPHRHKPHECMLQGWSRLWLWQFGNVGPCWART